MRGGWGVERHRDRSRAVRFRPGAWRHLERVVREQSEWDSPQEGREKERNRRSNRKRHQGRFLSARMLESRWTSRAAPLRLVVEQRFELLVGFVPESLLVLARGALQQVKQLAAELVAELGNVPQVVDDQPLRFKRISLQAGDDGLAGDAPGPGFWVLPTHRLQVIEQFFRL